MIKIKSMNREIRKKLMAFTLATTTSFTAVSGVYAKEGDMCYEEQTVFEYKTIAGDYIVKKKYDNSIEITESNSRNTNRLTLSKDGEVKITTQNSKYLGVFNDVDTTTFKITNFNSQRLDIENLNTKNNDVKKVLDALEKYIESSPINGENYIEILGEDFLDNSVLCYNNYDIRDVVNTSKNQYMESATMLYNDLNGANIIESNSLLLGAEGLAGRILSNPELVAKLASAAKTTVGVGIVLLVFTMFYDDIIVAGENVISLADKFFDNTSDYTYDVGNVDVSDKTTWMTIDDAMPMIENNYADDNPNNDYFQAVIAKGQNNVYINFIHPLSIDEAANLLKVIALTGTTNLNIDFTNNIYTYQSEDAKRVIQYCGGNAGTSGGLLDKAECHAFWRGYNAFDKNMSSYNLNDLILNPRAKPGVYYWHYHFNGKLFNLEGKEEINSKHIFFGMPIIVTENNVNKAKKGKTYVNDIDNYDNISNNYSRSKSFKK